MQEPARTECLVCRKHWGEVTAPGGAVYQDDLIYVSHAGLFGDEHEHFLGHLFVEPKRHVAELADLTDQEAQAVGLYASRVARALMDALDVEHVYSFVFGDGVPHIHVHVIGRHRGTPREYWGTRVDEWPAARRGGSQKSQRWRPEFEMHSNALILRSVDALNAQHRRPGVRKGRAAHGELAEDK